MSREILEKERKQTERKGDPTIGGAGAHRKEVALEAGAIRVHIEEVGSLVIWGEKYDDYFVFEETKGGKEGGPYGLVPTGNHGSHGKTHTLVVVDGVGENLGGGGDRDALLVLQLVQGALPPEVPLPKGAVCGTSSHSTQQVGVDLNHLLDILRGCGEKFLSKKRVPFQRE